MVYLQIFTHIWLICMVDVGKYTIHDMDPIWVWNGCKPQKKQQAPGPPAPVDVTTPKVETPKKLIMEVVIVREKRGGVFEFTLLALFRFESMLILGCLRLVLVTLIVCVYLFVGLIMLDGICVSLFVLGQLNSFGMLKMFS